MDNRATSCSAAAILFDRVVVVQHTGEEQLFECALVQASLFHDLHPVLIVCMESVAWQLLFIWYSNSQFRSNRPSAPCSTSTPWSTSVSLLIFLVSGWSSWVNFCEGEVSLSIASPTRFYIIKMVRVMVVVMTCGRGVCRRVSSCSYYSKF